MGPAINFKAFEPHGSWGIVNGANHSKTFGSRERADPRPQLDVPGATAVMIRIEFDDIVNKFHPLWVASQVPDQFEQTFRRTRR